MSFNLKHLCAIIQISQKQSNYNQHDMTDKCEDTKGGQLEIHVKE